MKQTWSCQRVAGHGRVFCQQCTIFRAGPHYACHAQAHCPTDRSWPPRGPLTGRPSAAASERAAFFTRSMWNQSWLLSWPAICCCTQAVASCTRAACSSEGQAAAANVIWRRCGGGREGRATIEAPSNLVRMLELLCKVLRGGRG